jgi:hypothetical protein
LANNLMMPFLVKNSMFRTPVTTRKWLVGACCALLLFQAGIGPCGCWEENLWCKTGSAMHSWFANKVKAAWFDSDSSFGHDVPSRICTSTSNQLFNAITQEEPGGEAIEESDCKCAGKRPFVNPRFRFSVDGTSAQDCATLSQGCLFNTSLCDADRASRQTHAADAEDLQVNRAPPVRAQLGVYLI